MGFRGGAAGRESACNEGDLGLSPGLGRSPGEGNGYPLQYSGLENIQDNVLVAQLSDSSTPWTAAHHVPPSMAFHRQEY